MSGWKCLTEDKIGQQAYFDRVWHRDDNEEVVIVRKISDRRYYISPNTENFQDDSKDEGPYPLAVAKALMRLRGSRHVEYEETA